MKLRIRSDSIRLRLSQSEVRQIAAREAATERTRFPNGLIFEYRLKPADVREITAVLEAQKIEVFLPVDQAVAWATSDLVSLTHVVANGADHGLMILVEKDFQCLKSRDIEREDETDLFSNPNSKANGGNGSCG